MIGDISLYQLLVPLFAILMIAKAMSRFLRHQQTIRELILWFLLWFLISFVALFPDYSIHWIAKISGVKSGINALIFFALVVLFYGFLHLFVAVEKNERTMTQLIRKIALQDVQKRKNDQEGI